MTHRTVVIVDDEHILRESLEMLIATGGYLPWSFESGKAVLRWLQPSTEAVLLVDIRMPEMNGLELAAALRNSGRCQPIIFMTGHSTASLVTRARAGGASAFLTKPFNSETLFTAIKAGFADLDEAIRADHCGETAAWLESVR